MKKLLKSITAIAVPLERRHALQEVQAHVFNTTFNPTNQRLGNKILRQRLRGPALAQYYPPNIRPLQELRKAFPDWQVVDEKEQARLESIEAHKARGKGVPKKKKTKEEGKKFMKKR